MKIDEKRETDNSSVCWLKRADSQCMQLRVMVKKWSKAEQFSKKVHE